MSPFAPSHFGTIPVPYIVHGPSLFPAHPVRYRMDALDLPMQRFQMTKKSAGDYLRFAAAIGLPLTVADDIDALRTMFGMLFGSIARPAARADEVERYAYSAIDSTCRTNGARMVMLDLAFGQASAVRPIPGLKTPPIVANADSLLQMRLGNESGAAFSRAYRYWGWNGRDSVLVDPHPNERAHRVIAECLVAALRTQSREGEQVSSAPCRNVQMEDSFQNPGK
jgi:hypothetical protein